MDYVVSSHLLTFARGKFLQITTIEPLYFDVIYNENYYMMNMKFNRSGSKYFVDFPGRKEGVYLEASRSGAPEFIGMFQNGLKEGFFTEYYENGRMKSRTEYSKDKQVGKREEWDKNGTEIL
jgi:antitoxin component YwqK of YwqJK toxin-antitoxin module